VRGRGERAAKRRPDRPFLGTRPEARLGRCEASVWTHLCPGRRDPNEWVRPRRAVRWSAGEAGEVPPDWRRLGLDGRARPRRARPSGGRTVPSSGRGRKHGWAGARPPFGHTSDLVGVTPMSGRPRRAVRLSKSGSGRISRRRTAEPAGSFLRGRGVAVALAEDFGRGSKGADEGGVTLVKEPSGCFRRGMDPRRLRAVEPGGPEPRALLQDRGDAEHGSPGDLAGSRALSAVGGGQQVGPAGMARARPSPRTRIARG
jgi:hypothetical protein